jgi:hypothetical protein
MKISAKQFAKSPLEAYRRADRGEEVIIEHARYPDVHFTLTRMQIEEASKDPDISAETHKILSHRISRHIINSCYELHNKSVRLDIIVRDKETRQNDILTITAKTKSDAMAFAFKNHGFILEDFKLSKKMEPLAGSSIKTEYLY